MFIIGLRISKSIKLGKHIKSNLSKSGVRSSGIGRASNKLFLTCMEIFIVLFILDAFTFKSNYLIAACGVLLIIIYIVIMMDISKKLNNIENSETSEKEV